MGFYPQVVNIQNAVVTASDQSVTGGLGFFDVDSKTTKYAFQATVTPFDNTAEDSFEFKISDSADFFRDVIYESLDTNLSGVISSSFSASFALGGRSQVINGITSSLHPGLYIENQFITESFSGSSDFSIFNTQLTASKGLNFYHRHMSGSLTQSLYLTASEGFFVTGSSFFKGETSFENNVTVGGNLTVQGATTTVSSSNTTFKDSIIGLGITGSETFNNVGDRGIIFGRGASASSTLPGLWWDGTQFNLAESATSPASSSFGSITSYSPIRVGTLSIGGTQVTSTAAELNLLDGGTSVGSSITLADSDGVIVNDAGTTKLVPVSDIKGYVKPFTYQAKSADFTAAASYHYGVTTTSGNIVATLPAASSNTDANIRFKIKAGSNALILDASGSDTIDGLISLALTDVSQSLSVMSDGTSNWEIF